MVAHCAAQVVLVQKVLLEGQQRCDHMSETHERILVRDNHLNHCYRISKKTLLVRNAINMRCLDNYFSRKRLEIYTDS